MDWTPKWVKLPIFDFVRKVYEFRDKPDEGWKWVMDFANALMLGRTDSGCELASRVIAEAMDFASKKSEAGRLGGIASARARASGKNMTVEQVYDFARENGLDEADARDWYEMTIVDRGGKTRNGDTIVNWKGACKRFCTARAKARNKDGEKQ